MRLLNIEYKDNVVKKLFAVLVPMALVLSACATTDTIGTTSTPSTTQQLGAAALKIAVNAKCVTEINNLDVWNTATKLMTNAQKEEIESEICGCVSEKAPQSVSAMDLATAAFDPAARTTIVTNAVTKTINACVAEAVAK